jgi:hypothetical protein
MHALYHADALNSFPKENKEEGKKIQKKGGRRGTALPNSQKATRT